jgi:plasmid stabilization system protein ParE
MVRINWSKLALNVLKNIADFISKDSKVYAKRHISRIILRTKILKKFPKAGKVTSEIAEDCIRELVLGNYRIIYEIISEMQVDILTIHHSSRDLTKTIINKQHK